MGKKIEDPVWLVYVDDFNGRKIKEFNVFHSHNFLEGCKKVFKKYKVPEQLDEINKEVQNWARYSFWSKCEYEIVLSSFPPTREGKEARKIDVFDQLMLNWNMFIKYTVEHKAYFLRKEKKGQ